MSVDTTAISSVPAPLSCTGVADAPTAGELRRTLRSWLRRLPQASAEISEDIVLGVNEALANCVEHAYRTADAAGTMRLQAGYDPAAETISVCVSDRGTWHRRPLRSSHDPRASRGIILMHALADNCSIDTRPGGTTVCLDYFANQRH
ncbi:anti-sigma regulatory factor [Mycobacterium sp. 1100029.7]|nr:anti-sigma regulatory factor [Mycobacterium sp. 1100029.7]